MILKTAPEMDTRILSWSEHVKQPPELLIEGVLNEALDDWEDYHDALCICSEVDAGRMKTYSLEEVEKHLDELEG